MSQRQPILLCAATHVILDPSTSLNSPREPFVLNTYALGRSGDDLPEPFVLEVEGNIEFAV